MVDIPAGAATLGRKHSDGFGWDNEFDQHEVAVAAFAVGQHKITNGEYLEFVTAGASAPHFWICHDGEWYYRGMFEDIQLPLDWPVYVSHDQAQGLRPMEGPIAAHGSAIPSRGIRRRSGFRARKCEFSKLGSGAGHGFASKRIRRFANGRQRVGMDGHALRAVPRLRALPLLSRLFGEFLRRPALMC